VACLKILSSVFLLKAVVRLLQRVSIISDTGAAICTAVVVARCNGNW
jgi:hypothetical protein